MVSGYSGKGGRSTKGDESRITEKRHKKTGCFSVSSIQGPTKSLQWKHKKAPGKDCIYRIPTGFFRLFHCILKSKFGRFWILFAEIYRYHRATRKNPRNNNLSHQNKFYKHFLQKNPLFLHLKEKVGSLQSAVGQVQSEKHAEGVQDFSLWACVQAARVSESRPRSGCYAPCALKERGRL